MRPAVRIIFAPIARRHRGPNQVLGKALGRTVWIDPRHRDLGSTLLHELLHVRHPSWSEEMVIAEERKRWRKFTWKQKARYIQMLASAKLEGEE